MTKYISIKHHILKGDLSAIAYDCYNQFACSHKMCRTYDPVVLATGDESYSAYGFHTSVLAVAKGYAKMDELLDSFTYCLECASCEVRCPNTLFAGDFYKNTTTTVDLVRYVRRQLIEQGLRFKNWDNIIDALSKLESVTVDDVSSWRRDLNIRVNASSDNVILVDVFTATQMSSIVRDVTQILQKLNIDFSVVEAEKPLQQEYLSINVNKFRDHAKDIISKVSKVNPKNVVVLNPHMLTMLTREYAKYVDDDMGFSVTFFTDFLWDLYRKGSLKLVNEINMRVVYHDPCNLTKMNGVYESPRALLRAIPGIELLEEHPVTQWRYCCGFGNYIFKNANPDVSLKIGRNRIERALELQPDAIVVACPHCMEQFMETVTTMKLELPIVHLTELLLRSLG